MLLLLSACQSPGSPPLPVDTTAWVDATYGSIVHVAWAQARVATTWVEYRVGDEPWRSTPPVARAPGHAEQLLLGVPYDVEVTWRVVQDLGGGPVSDGEAVVRTDALPEGIPEPVFVEGDPDRWDPAAPFLFLSLSNLVVDRQTWALVVDRQGRVVWAEASPQGATSLHPRVSIDGRDLLVDRNSFWGMLDGGGASQVLRMKIDGTVLATYETPGLHHPFVDLPDGSLVWTALAQGIETVQRVALDGATEELWDCHSLLDPLGIAEECLSNTLWWDAATNHLYDSLCTLNTIVEIDLTTGTAARWFGALPGSWAFDPPESQFWWQHGGHLTESGTLLTSTKDREDGEETVVREYRLDEASQTLVEVWTAAEGVYGDIYGEAHRLDNGNTLENYGSATRIQEITPEGEVVWDIDWDCELLGRSTPIADLYAFLP